jgi:hypothetical protein
MIIVHQMKGVNAMGKEKLDSFSKILRGLEEEFHTCLWHCHG